MKYVCECGAEIDAESLIDRYDTPLREVDGAIKATQVLVYPGSVICGSCGYQMGLVASEVADA